jgi:N6-adenosine-specific RNA methylase IME4
MQYSVILADPPWHFQNYSADAPGQIHERSRGANKHYPTMTTADLCGLTIPAADDAVLFLWACWPLLVDAMQVVAAWGFEYKTLAWVWVKANPSYTGFFRGMGYYTRSNSEPCLLATRGKPRKPVDRSVGSVLYTPVRRHSQKPDEQYDKIARLYPIGPRLEMFARQARAGWDALGNGLDGRDIREILRDAA